MVRKKIVDFDVMLADRNPRVPAPLSYSLRVNLADGAIEDWEITFDALRKLLILAARIPPGAKAH